jgi:hypothetical protein
VNPHAFFHDKCRCDEDAMSKCVGVLAATGLVLFTACEMRVKGAELRIPITIRIYNNAGVPLQRLQAAQQTAARILGGVGVEPQWRDCRTSRGPSARAADTCRNALGSLELIVRIVSAPRGWKDPAAFAYSLVDGAIRRGTVSTVFADRIDASAARVSIDAGVLLARVLAHELGHLLLGTNAHAAHGLMRARWEDDELTRNVTRDWEFSPSEEASIQRVLPVRPQTAGEPFTMATLQSRSDR